MMGEPI